MNLPRPISYFFVLTLLLSLLSSCSWLGNRKTLFDTDEDKEKLRPRKTVPKHQYDELLAKYEMLKKKKDQENIQPMPEVSSVDLIKDLNKTERPSRPEIIKKVNVFEENDRPAMSDKTVNTEVLNFNKAIKKLQQGNGNDAMKVFKDLENSPSKQVKSRAKFYIGELLFAQKEYDLALQKFEEIIGQYAFSGIVLKTLGRLVICSEKLGLKEKEERYHSILYDFFGS